MSDVTEKNIEQNLEKWEPHVIKKLKKDKQIWKKWCDDFEDPTCRAYWATFKYKQYKVMVQHGLVPLPLQGKAPCCDNWTTLLPTKENMLKIFISFINNEQLYGTGKGKKADEEYNNWKAEKKKREDSGKKYDVPPPHFWYSCNFTKGGFFDRPYVGYDRFSGIRTLGLGILTANSNIEIDDIDTKNGGKGLESHIEMCEDARIDREKYIKSTLFVKSGSGNGAGHLYNRVPPGTTFGKSYKGLKDLDILCGGCQVVGPWNKHPCGGYYEIDLKENEPFPITTFGFDKIKPIPIEIMKILGTKKVKKEKEKETPDLEDSDGEVVELDTEKEIINNPEFDIEEDIIKPQAAKELTVLLDPWYRRSFKFVKKRELQWDLQYLGNTAEHKTIYLDMWERQKGETKNTKGWHNAPVVIKGFNRALHKGGGLDYILQEMRWIHLPEDMKIAHKLRAIKEKDALVDAWVSRWLPARIEIKEYDEIYNEKFVKDLPIGETTILIKSHCGTGKSTAIRNLMTKIQGSLARPIRIVYFCNRKSYGFNTIEDLKKELGEDFVLYSDTPDFYKHDKILVEIESLHRMEGIIEELQKSGMTIDIVAFDECESGLKQWTSKPVMRNWRGNTFTLKALMEIGERVVFADSFLSQRTENFVKNTRKEMYKIHNLRKLVKKETRIITEEGRLYAIIEDRIERGENWFGVIPEKGMAIRIHNKLVAKFGDIGCLYHGETNNKEELKHVNENWVKYRWVIQTLTNTVGIDFNVKGHFNGVFVFASNKKCGLARDLIQSMLRVRHLKDNLVYICIKDTKRRPRYGYTLKAINFNIKRIERRNQELLEIVRKPLTKAELREYAKELGSIASEEFKKFQRHWSQLLDKNGEPTTFTFDDKPPKFLEDLQLYHHHEEAQNEGRYTETLMGYLADINCHIVDDAVARTLDNDYNLGIDIIQKEKRKEVVPIGDIPNMEETRAHALAKYVDLNERLGDMAFDEHQGRRQYPEELKTKMEINMINWLKYRKRLDSIMLGRTKDFWDDEERLSYEKYCFLNIFNYDPEDVAFVNIWKKWNNNQTFRQCTYVTIEIVNTLRKYELAKEKGFYKGEWEDFFNLNSFIKRDYYTIMGEKHLQRKWAIKLLKMIASISNEAQGESLINKIMGDDGINISLEGRNKIDEFITQNEQIISDELGMGIREKSAEGKWIHSQDKINYTVSFILKTYLGLKLIPVKKRVTVKKNRLRKTIRKEVQVQTWVTSGWRVSFFSPFSLLKAWNQR